MFVRLTSAQQSLALTASVLVTAALVLFSTPIVSIA